MKIWQTSTRVTNSFSFSISEQVNISCSTQAAIDKERRQVESFRLAENRLFAAEFDYMTLDGLRIEARQS